ncbi:MAG: hypothetical protein IPP61_17930 [Cytophagaceae bacterium]|nr:hypothetical protein [Cytophagaceae bacterium]
METCCIQEVNSINWKEYIPLISPVVVVLLFGIERILSYFIRKREIERTWYYKVLLDPSLEKIDTFFLYTVDLYISSCKLLAASQEIPHNSYISMKSSEIGNFQKIKRTFDSDIVTPIIHRYPDTGNKLQNSLLDLEDLFSSSLDEKKFTQTDIEDFQVKVSSAKALWLNTLYEPIQ